jgi:branched-chain amino acid transport system permease protein
MKDSNPLGMKTVIQWGTLLKPLLVALWLSFLFLPFKGIRAAILFFCAILISLLLWKMFLKFRGSLAGILPGFRLPVWFSQRQMHCIVFLSFISALAIPFFAGDYFLDIAILAGIYIILALGLNIVVGFAGLLNLGFAAFYAIGAYAYALLHTKLGIGFWTAMPASLVLTTLFGFLLAIPALRLRGDYLAIVTLGFGEITRLIVNNWDSLTQGPNGISGIGRPEILSFPLNTLASFYYLVVCCVILTLFIIKRVHASRIGRAWIALREDEIASSVMGIHITAYKLYAFAFGAFWAGLAGSLFTAKMQFVSPESFTFMESVLIICMVILGGLGSIPGVVIGALILIILPEMLREVQLYRMLALGSGLVLLMIFRPQGLLGGKGVSLRG